MIQRSDMQALLTMVLERPEKVKQLNAKDKDFIANMRVQVGTYGYAFSEKQFNWLQSIYRKVYRNV